LLSPKIFEERALLYKVLSLALYTPSDIQSQNELKTLLPAVRQVSLVKMDPETIDKFVDAWITAWDGSQGDLKEEYTRLFVNDYPELKCPPFETYWATGERTIYGHNYDSLLGIYREAGLDRAPDVGLPLEHVALELELMYYLVASSPLQPEYLCLQEKLFREHIEKWADGYSRCLEENAKLENYKATARLLREFVASERAFFEESKFCV
jgi:TorA maturation chaperone TorD